MKDAYGDRIFAFDHFSRQPHARAERADAARRRCRSRRRRSTSSRIRAAGSCCAISWSAPASSASSRAASSSVARCSSPSPNDGTPLATPKRWDDTVGWIANLLEMFPDNPFTTGAAFVANGLVWLANHASGDLPGLHAMDGDGDLIAAIRGRPVRPATRTPRSSPTTSRPASVLQRLLDVGIDQFSASANDLVVPSEGGWRIDRSSTAFIPAARIGCFGPGGNLPGDSVTHVNFFSHAGDGGLPRQRAARPAAAARRASIPRKDAARSPAAARRSTDGPAPGIAPVHRCRSAAEPARGRRPRRRRAAANHRRQRRPDVRAPSRCCSATTVRRELTGTEKVMDRLIGGTMSASLERRALSGARRLAQIFINTRPNLERGTFMPRPKAVIVVGLGAEGKLRPADLVQTVRQAVIAWAQRLAERRDAGDDLRAGRDAARQRRHRHHAGEAAQLIAQGVHEANDSLLPSTRGQTTALAAGRATCASSSCIWIARRDAWRSLRLQAAATPGGYDRRRRHEAGHGALQRPPDSGYRGADYDFITAVETKDEDGSRDRLHRSTRDVPAAKCADSARRAAAPRTWCDGVERSEHATSRSAARCSICSFPVELEPYLAGSGEMQIELDPRTAGIPVGAARHSSATATATSAVGDPRQAAAQAAHPRVPRARHRRRRRRQRARHRRAGVHPTKYPRLYGARARGARGLATVSTALDATRRPIRGHGD